jgi:hypothetical protein
MDTLNFASVGTWFKNRKNMPRMSDKLECGEVEFIINIWGVLAVKWIDTKEATVLSNCHGKGMFEVRKGQKDGTSIIVGWYGFRWSNGRSVWCRQKISKLVEESLQSITNISSAVKLQGTQTAAQVTTCRLPSQTSKSSYSTQSALLSCKAPFLFQKKVKACQSMPAEGQKRHRHADWA